MNNEPRLSKSARTIRLRLSITRLLAGEHWKSTVRSGSDDCPQTGTATTTTALLLTECHRAGMAPTWRGRESRGPAALLRRDRGIGAGAGEGAGERIIIIGRRCDFGGKRWIKERLKAVVQP